MYPYVFETPVPQHAGIMSAQTQAPRPYILEPPLETRQHYEPGEELCFGLVLIGRAVSYLPYFICAFEELGRLGIGRGKGTFELVQVRRRAVGSADPVGEVLYRPGQREMAQPGPGQGWGELVPLPPRTKTLHLRFLTPTRLVRDGRLVMPRELSFGTLVRALMRRIGLLSYFHCGRRHEVSGWESFLGQAEAVTTQADNLHWHDWERYSNRQKARINMGGLMGELTYEGDFTPFWPYLSLGKHIHIGKGGSFGLGWYDLLC